VPRHSVPIHPLPSGRYQLRFRDQFQNEFKESFDTYPQAEARWEQVRYQVRRGTYIDESKRSQPFGEFAAEWADSRDWTATSRQSWRDVCKRIEPYLGDKPLADIDKLMLETMQQSLRKSYKRNTVKLTIS
jgi:hypothetical protein